MRKWRAITAFQKSLVTNYLYCICVALMLIFLVPNTGEGKSKDGFYIGVGVTNVSIGGDFDGDNFVSGGGSAEVFPKMEDAQGIKYILGFQSNIGGIDLSYSRSEHDGNWAGIDMTSVFKSYDIDFHILLLKTTYIVRPRLTLGAGINRLTVEDGSTDGFSVDDAIFKGAAVRLGAGLELSLHERFAIDAMAIYRWGRYNKVEGIVEGDLDDIDGNGATYSAEVKFIF